MKFLFTKLTPESRENTRLVVEIAGLVAVIATLYTAVQAMNSSNEAIKAAKGANDIASKILKVEQRPYLAAITQLNPNLKVEITTLSEAPATLRKITVERSGRSLFPPLPLNEHVNSKDSYKTEFGTEQSISVLTDGTPFSLVVRYLDPIGTEYEVEFRRIWKAERKEFKNIGQSFRKGLEN